MSEQKMIITDAGLAEIINAEASGTAPVVLSHIAFGSGQYTATKTMTALKTEFKRFESIKGGAIDDKTIHLSVHDNSEDTYTVFEVGVFTESGTLFAVYSQTTPIVQKATGSEMMFVSDIVFADINVSSVTVGDTNIILNPATTETAGLIELATEAEAKAGTDATRAITPKTLDATIEAHDNIVHRSGNEYISGNKTFTGNLIVSKESPFILVSQDDIIKGTTPSTSQYMGVSFTDSEGHATTNRLGLVETKYMADGGTCLSLSAYKPEKGSTASAGIEIIYPATGSAYVNAPTPATGDNSTKIATTACVEGKLKNYLPLAGGTMQGIINCNGKPFTNPSYIEFKPNSTNNGGYLDFHFAGSTEDYTSRIIEDGEGRLTMVAPSGVRINNKNLVQSVNNTNADASGNVSISSVASATKATQDGNGKVIADTYLPRAGGKMTSTKAMARDVNNSYLALYGGTGEGNDGAHLDLCGANHSSMPGTFQLHARNSVSDVILRGDINGDLTWDGKHVLNNSFLMPSDSGAINLTAGTSSAGGAYFRLYGKEHETGAGQFVLATTDGESTNALVGKPDGTLTWNGNSISNPIKDASISGKDITLTFADNSTKTLTTQDTTGVTPKAYITETYISGASWYRKYSDGWIEQGGVVASGAKDKSFTFPKAFSNTNYTLVASSEHDNSTRDIYGLVIHNRTTTGATIFVGADQGSQVKRRWYACGY